jgi:predicted O-linked N-acetylglucosamine transferase (SPINDLY family)
MGLPAEARIVPTEAFAAAYPRLRDCCDLDGIERLGDPWSQCEGLRPAELQGLLRYMLSEARDLEASRRLVALHRYWGDSALLQAACEPLPPFPPRRRREKLRIGLLSSNLCRHPVGVHLLPWLRSYDRGRLEIVAFSPEESPGDPVQAEIRSLVSGFEVLGGGSLRETALRIRESGIDILLDLNGHTVGNRLGALAYRAAPIQAHWLGYQFTTGLPAVDHFLMDARIAPDAPGLLCESPRFIPESWVCYEGAEAATDPEPPSVRNGFVTFGTLAHPFKFTRPAFAAWARALDAVPGSRFLVVRPESGDARFRANVVAAFAREGIGAGCVDFLDNAASGRSHFDCYNELDVALDPLPVCGGTTTCDSLWMGVPVVTLVGPVPHQRLSRSLLASAGLDDLCAYSVEDCGEIAAGLAAAETRRANMRRELRGRVKASALGDAALFAANFQSVLDDLARRL